MIALSIEEDNKYLLNEEVLELTLPCNWWNTSNSFSFYANGNENKLYGFNEKVTKVSHNINNERKILQEPTFDASLGDYILNDQGYLKKDYAYHIKIRERILKYSIYPAVFFALMFTFFILDLIAKLSA